MIGSDAVHATIQARMTSSRLPGKVLMPAAGKPLLHHMVERLHKVTAIDKVIIATTTNSEDDPVAELAEKTGAGLYRGSEDDVLSRVLDATVAHGTDILVQTTGDCPLIDPEIIGQVIDHYVATECDYTSNTLIRSYPIGMDTQIYRRTVLEDVASRTQDPVDREHVSAYIYHHPERYSLSNLHAPDDMTDPMLRLTLDTPEDYEVIWRIYEALYPANPDFTLADILALLKRNPDWRAINDQVEHKWLRRP
ncbi:MAG: glycosyltransferase family protein [Rhodospirillales bacterium]